MLCGCFRDRLGPTGWLALTIACAVGYFLWATLNAAKVWHSSARLAPHGHLQIIHKLLGLSEGVNSVGADYGMASLLMACEHGHGYWVVGVWAARV